MSGPYGSIDAIESLLRPHGLMPRGVVRFGGDGPVLDGGGQAASVVLVGHAGSSFWPAFTVWREARADGGGADPLDSWSKSVISPLAQALGATAYYPSEKPYQPFQRWAMAAEGLTASPLGILIHPVYGLWHGYRGALGFAEVLEDGRTAVESRDPCSDCREKPCISHCPADALATGSFDVGLCRACLGSPAGQGGCMTAGCAARSACPVGAGYRYRDEQVRFHMRALRIPAG